MAEKKLGKPCRRNQKVALEQTLEQLYEKAQSIENLLEQAIEQLYEQNQMEKS